MFEKVNPSHPDKIADRIAGAIVDFAYGIDIRPKIAVEVLLGHGNCHIIAESSVPISPDAVKPIINRIAGVGITLDLQVVPQDEHLAKNQSRLVRCGDNGIFKGCPTTAEQSELAGIARAIYGAFPSDGKYIINGRALIICQSRAKREEIEQLIKRAATINPLGEWDGGTNVDTGATNRKLGSDMGDAVTGGGLHGKDLSKADVSVNIFAHYLAEQYGRPVELMCAIGDVCVSVPDKSGKYRLMRYEEIVNFARAYIRKAGDFEKFAEWGLI